MGIELNTITINGKEYVERGHTSPVESLDGMEYVIVRTYTAGVFAGYLKSRNGQEVVLKKARRLWSWSGAASLSELSQTGTAKPKDCKFPEEVETVTLLQAIEILNVTSKAKKSIDGVAVWKQN